MAKKHETLSAQAEELSRKLAAARLRGLLAERERRRGGWDEGLAQREEARARLDALDSEVLARADARAAVARRLAEVEIRFRNAEADRAEADRTFRFALDRESEARQALASQAGRAARLDAIQAELSRVEADLDGRWPSSPIGSASSRMPKPRSGRRISIGARSTSSGGEPARRPWDVAWRSRRSSARSPPASARATDSRRSWEPPGIGARRSTASARRSRRTSSVSTDRRHRWRSAARSSRPNAVARSRRSRSSTTSSAGSERASSSWRRAGATSRKRPDSRFLGAHRGRSAGVLKDLVRAEPGLERALLAALGPLADAVVFEDRAQALAAAPDGDGAILAIAAGGPVPQGLSGERPLLSAVDAEPAARGIVSTVLRDVYLAGSIEEAAEKQDAHPTASFVTPDGTLVGPAVIHTPRETDDRVREIKAEIQVLAHDLAGTRSRLKPQRQRMEETSGEIEFLNQQIEAADTDITTAAERLAAIERDLRRGRHGGRPVLRAPAERARSARPPHADRLAELGPAGLEEIPELPAAPTASGPGPRDGRDAPARSRVVGCAARAAAHRTGRGHPPTIRNSSARSSRERRRREGSRGSRPPPRRARAAEAAEERDAATHGRAGRRVTGGRDQQGVARGVHGARSAPGDLRGRRPAPRRHRTAGARRGAAPSGGIRTGAGRRPRDGDGRRFGRSRWRRPASSSSGGSASSGA